MQRNPSVILTDFCPVQLSEPIDQADYIQSLADMMVRSWAARHPEASDAEKERAGNEIREKVEKFSVSPNYIAKRQLNAVVPVEDSGRLGLSTFPDIENDPEGLPINERMADNDRLTDEVFSRIYADETEAPDDLVHVTSGGYSAPSPPQRLLAAKGWSDTVVSHVYHMGCFAAFPAVRAAMGALYSSQALEPDNPKKRADVLHAEYFSLHVKLGAQEPEDIISFTLFGDGFIKYSAVPESEYDSERGGLRIMAMQDAIVPASADEMT